MFLLSPPDETHEMKHTKESNCTKFHYKIFDYSDESSNATLRGGDQRCINDYFTPKETVWRSRRLSCPPFQPTLPIFPDINAYRGSEGGGLWAVGCGLRAFYLVSWRLPPLSPPGSSDLSSERHHLRSKITRHAVLRKVLPGTTYIYTLPMVIIRI